MDNSKLEWMILIAKKENPSIDSNNELAGIISKTFGINCKERDINLYYASIQHEDYELEQRKFECKY